MHRAVRLTPILLACWLPAATLLRLSMYEMVQKSTSVVRGRVLAASASVRGTPGRGTIYTHYTVQVLERWKGPAVSKIDVAVPGGVVQNRRQSYPGAPALEINTDYILFLWTGPSGLSQIIGLSQGLINVKADASGNPVLSRCASHEQMLDTSGATVTDTAFSMTLAEFRTTMKKYGMAAVN